MQNNKTNKNHLKHIYIILTGENEKTRPRSKKLLQLITKKPLKTQQNQNQYKIIISGHSSFNLSTKLSECKNLQKYLIQNNIPKQNTILENKSLDTLGNIIFSYQTIQNIYKTQNITTNQKITIHLITEKFHLNRSKKLFLKIFKNFITTHPNTTLKFQSPNTNPFRITHLKHEIKTIKYKLKHHLKIKQNIKKIIQEINQTEKTTLKELLLLESILLDFKHYNLKTQTDFENYLYSLPIYNQKYKPQTKLNLKTSLYAKGIKIKNHLKN